MADGSGFSGTLKTTDAKGENIAITYVDGIMRKSSINGKLYKTWSPITGEGNATGTDIITFLKDGSKQYTRLWFHDNGKVKYIIKAAENNLGFGKLTGYSKSGKKFVEAQCNGSNQDYAKYFDENGQMVRHIYSTDPEQCHSGRCAEDVFENGSLIKRYWGHPENNFMQMIAGDKPLVRRSVQYFDHGMPKPVIFSVFRCIPRMDAREAKISNLTFDIPPSLGGSLRLDINGTLNNQCWCIKIDRETGKIINADIGQQGAPLSQENLKEIFSKVDTLIDVTQKENLDHNLVNEFYNIPDLVRKAKEQLLK